MPTSHGRRILLLGLLALAGETLEFSPASGTGAAHDGSGSRMCRLWRALRAGAGRAARPPVQLLPHALAPMLAGPGLRMAASVAAQDSDELDRMTVEAIAESLAGVAQSDKIVTKALRKLGRSINNQQRATFSRRVLGVSVLRQRLAYIADTVDAKAQGGGMPLPDLAHHEYGRAHKAADLLALYIFYHEQDALLQRNSAGVPEEATAARVEQLSFVSCDRAHALASLDLERDVWLPLRAVPGGSFCEAVALETSMPLWLIRRWLPEGDAASYGRKRELLELARAFNAIPPVYLRANMLALSRDALIRALAAAGTEAQPVPLVPWAVRLSNGRPATGLRTPEWEAGLFEVQDAGSQIIAFATEAAQGEIVVDFCAGNGGKTLALAAMVRDRAA